MVDGSGKWWKEGGRWWWKVVVVGAWWEERKKMNGDGDVGDGNGLASVTGTAYTGELLNGWRRFDAFGC